ncbi:sugar transferase [Seonamhaeicola marinus]|uniref:Sugar transferase n=1 Tax=Seonamhaeicola marinus TaxID=1912246 RepID=A0A5D0HL85_9FLAO|nr:sugar transferase [Seonamhaeicola marinus]TYA72048.1 sugar transferase [Seonamhaeicola marinus]
MYRLFKRIFDLFSAIIAFLLLSPLFIVACISLFITNKGKIFFLQERPGKNGGIFKIIKFKTMRDLKATDSSAHSLNRVTKIGSVIRKYSIDEIPQLINVIKGDMSIVGPRPLLVQYLPLYNEHQKKRHNVLPGITGWAQIKGRNSLSWDEKFNFDVWYVENQSLLLDLKIILLTIKKVLKPDGINNDDSSDIVMPEFTGSN